MIPVLSKVNEKGSKRRLLMREIQGKNEGTNEDTFRFVLFLPFDEQEVSMDGPVFRLQVCLLIRDDVGLGCKAE